jgi:hypothetical protein
VVVLVTTPPLSKLLGLEQLGRASPVETTLSRVTRFRLVVVVVRVRSVKLRPVLTSLVTVVTVLPRQLLALVFFALVVVGVTTLWRLTLLALAV